MDPRPRFRVAPPGEPRRPLVPDLAYVAKERLAVLSDAREVAHKVSVYLAAGSALVVVIDPGDRSVRLHDPRTVRALRDDDVVAHDAMPGFSLSLAELFAVLDRTR